MKTLCPLLLSLALISALSGQVYGQEKVNIAAGFGFPEVVFAGVRYQLPQAQIGFDVGLEPFSRVDWITLSLNGYYHFAGTSRFSERRPWYGRVGLIFTRQKEENLFDNYFDFSLRAGRDFNITSGLGIACDAGIMIGEAGQIMGEWDTYFFLAPSLGITLFYRL